ncbi:hypothetical protein AB4Y40_12265 [Paraburkholderia sp. EG287B]|uniref:hypothetical protein n=1 Tax=unclassified Paraburkholderia TaxID=2615204 RepID=UPI0034D22A2F
MSNESLTQFNAGAQAWAEHFGAAPLTVAHAATLVEAAHATVRAVADAAQLLDWIEADAFAQTLQQTEPGHAR